MVKIAFFLPSLGGGGTERNVVNLLRNLNKENFKLSLVLGEKKGIFLKEIPKEIPVIALGTINLLKVFLRLKKYFKKERPDFFISAFPHFNIISIGAKFFSQTQTKVIITEQTALSLFHLAAKTFFRKLLARFFLPVLVRIIYPRADGIICVSQGVADELYTIIGTDKPPTTFVPKVVGGTVGGKIRVIYNPVVEQRIYQLAQEPIEHPWFKNSQIPIILSVGSLIKIKDFSTLLFAFKLVLKEQPARLVILGQGKEEKKLENLSKKLGLSENAAFLGFQENPYKYMKQALIFVLSSKMEGFSNVLVEAMACGTAVVSTNCTGPSEIIKNGKNGILVPIGDQKALAEAILKILNDPYLRKKLSQEGKKRAEDFSAEKKAKEYEQLILELL